MDASAAFRDATWSARPSMLSIMSRSRSLGVLAAVLIGVAVVIAIIALVLPGQVKADFLSDAEDLLEAQRQALLAWIAAAVFALGGMFAAVVRIAVRPDTD